MKNVMKALVFGTVTLAAMVGHAKVQCAVSAESTEMQFDVALAVTELSKGSFQQILVESDRTYFATQDQNGMLTVGISDTRTGKVIALATGMDGKWAHLIVPGRSFLCNEI